MVDQQNTLQKGGCIIRIESVYDSLKSAELRLADYILKNGEVVIDSSIHELQERSGSSYATIIRFCKKIGYPGFKAFKKSLAYDIDHHDPDTYAGTAFPIVLDDTIESIIEKNYRSSVNILTDTKNMLSNQTLDRAVDKIIHARETYFIGTGNSGIVAHYASARFFRIGIKCSTETDATIYKIKTAILDKEDLLFAISSSGRSSAVVDAARIARQRGVPVISLCDFAITPLSRTSDINLYTTPRNVTHFLDMEMPLIIGQISIIDVLFICCCLKMGKNSFSRYHTTKQFADREKI